MEKVNLREKLATFSDHWNPRIVAELNGQQVKLVKIQGPFTWQPPGQRGRAFFWWSRAVSAWVPGR